MHTKTIITAGVHVKEADKVLILLHGRGASARDILSLAPLLYVPGFALVAPQATSHTWYPHSFLAPPQSNEPWLSSAMSTLKSGVDDLLEQGYNTDDIYILGFSQGACVALEFVARNAAKYGGVAALTGGLIGDRIYPENYSGDFAQTPVLISTGDPDLHVPVQRVLESAELLKKMNADVRTEIYQGRPHTISEQEIDIVNSFILGKEA